MDIAAVDAVLGRRFQSMRRLIPPIVHLDELDAVVQASDGDAILMAQLLARHGLAVGISSGANVIGALRVLQRLAPQAVVVTVLADSNKKYLSTDLLRAEPVKDGYLTPQVEMLGFDSMNRVCEMCADPRRVEFNREKEQTCDATLP